MISAPVKWRGQSAVYTSAERLIMADLPVREQAFVHALKATIDGEISQGQVERTESPDGEIRVADFAVGSGEPADSKSPTVYTDPEELEFGRSDSPNRWRSETDRPKRRPKIYALVCTWKQSCVVPTKREGEFWMKVWKAWYERQGWKVKTHDTGYFATSPIPRVVHNKRESFDVYIGRPSKWGNPFSHAEGTLAEFKVDTRYEAIEAYGEWIKTQPELLASLPELRGKTLGCWCAPKKCHGEILAQMAGPERHAIGLDEYDRETKERIK